MTKAGTVASNICESSVGYFLMSPLWFCRGKAIGIKYYECVSVFLT